MAMGNNVGQVDHVVMMCRPENLAGATERLSKMLEIEFDYFEAPRQGIKGALSIGSGLEYIAPLCDGSAMSDSCSACSMRRARGFTPLLLGWQTQRRQKLGSTGKVSSRANRMMRLMRTRPTSCTKSSRSLKKFICASALRARFSYCLRSRLWTMDSQGAIFSHALLLRISRQSSGTH